MTRTALLVGETVLRTGLLLVMQLTKLKLLLWVAIGAVLGACGDGNQVSAPPVIPPPPPPLPTQAVGGAWVGRDSSGFEIFALSSEDGQLFWSARRGPYTPSTSGLPGNADGFGTITADSTDFSADYNYQPPFDPDEPESSRFPPGDLYYRCSAEGTILERQSLDVVTDCITTIDEPGTPFNSTASLTYDPLYDLDSSLATVSGNYSAPHEMNVTIDANGEIFGQSATIACVINGQIDIIDARFNAYDLSLTYSNCTEPYDAFNGFTLTGLAYVDTSAAERIIATVSIFTGRGFIIAEPFTLIRN